MVCGEFEVNDTNSFAHETSDEVDSVTHFKTSPP